MQLSSEDKRLLSSILVTRHSAQTAGGQRQLTVQTTQQSIQQTSTTDTLAQPHQRLSAQAPSAPIRGAGPLRTSRNGNNMNNSPTARTPRSLLTVLRSISSFGPTPEEREEIRSIFERAESNNIQIQAGNHSPAVKTDADARWRRVIDAHPRITRMPIGEKQKIARHVEKLEQLARRRRD